MYKHAIIIHMSYISSKRIAFHMLFQDSSEVKDINKDLIKKFQHLRFGFHVIQTHSDSIKSISEKDPFFDGIEYYIDYDQFIDVVRLDIKTHSTDVAKVILSESSFTPLCVQNVTFFSHVEYFRRHRKELLEESFEAWKHGPVIPELYQKLKSYQKNKVDMLDEYGKKILHARFLQIPSGGDIKKLIKDISNKNSKLTNSAIYREGHVEGGPWDLTCKNKGISHEIPKKIIKEYACSM